MKKSCLFMKSGYFKKKEVPFTQISNEPLRDSNLSLRAKGLYSMIQSYILIPDFTLYKWYLKNESGLGDKAFQTVWNELKNKGYLKQARVQTEKGNFVYEYELKEKADLETPAFVSVNRDGQVTSSIPTPEAGKTNLSTPLFLQGWTNHPVADGEGINNNIVNNNYVKSDRVIDEAAQSKKKIQDTCRSFKQKLIDYLNTYGELPVDIGTRANCTEAVQFLLEHADNENTWDVSEKTDYELFENSLIRMCTTKKPTMLIGEQVGRLDVIKKLSDQLEVYADENGSNHFSLFNFMTAVVDDYQQIRTTQNMRSRQACMKTCIWKRLRNTTENGSATLKKKQNGTISRQELRDYLIQNHELPFTILESENSCMEAVHLLTHYEQKYSNDELIQAAFELANYSLVQMMMTETTMNLRGAAVTGSKVLEFVNRCIEFTNNVYHPFTFEVIGDIVEDYCKAEMKAVEKNSLIKNKISYMQSCIWSQLVTNKVHNSVILAQVENW